MGLVLAAVPLLVWALETGPDAGHAGVPGEAGTCNQASCHVGPPAENAGGGSVKVDFPNGLNYTPVVKQHLVVTIADPTQRAWGFQITARPASSTTTMAGAFLSTDANTTRMCASANLFSQQEVRFNSSTPQTCPANMPLHYLEHSLAGYTATKGHTPSQTYEFDWMPPDTDVGPITIYVAGNAANGDLTNGGDHIYSATYTLNPAAAGPVPTISANGVVNGASFQPGMVPGSWFTIQGTNLSSTTNTWDKSIVDGKLPTSLDGVSVDVSGKAAYIYFVSPTQINALAPDAGTGTMSVKVTTASGGAGAPASVNSQTTSPAFFQWPGKAAVATRQDFTWAVKNGTFAGTTTVPAKPGDVIILWGTGFGPTNPAAPIGVQVPSDKAYSTASPVSVTINNVPAQVFGAALAPGFAGLYQVAIQVPASLPDGDLSVVASVNGVSSPSGVVLTVQK
jgi:uncharacterized protein (TIGR03437 family)